jgi:hypothetical protein
MGNAKKSIVDCYCSGKRQPLDALSSLLKLISGRSLLMFPPFERSGFFFAANDRKKPGIGSVVHFRIIILFMVVHYLPLLEMVFERLETKRIRVTIME